MTGYIVTGTDTDVGKTIFAAGLAGRLGGWYWKPVQAGLEDGGDAARVAALSGLAPDRILPEAYRLTTPCSPHRAARIDGVRIEDGALALPPQRPLVVEGAGGPLVPLRDDLLAADLFARWGLPAIIVARTALGTISHSLMTIEVLRARGVPIHGIVFIGSEVADSQETICRIGQVRSLGRLPWLDPLDAASLRNAFARDIAL